MIITSSFACAHGCLGDDTEGGLQGKASGALAKLCADLRLGGRAVSFCLCVLQDKAAQLIFSLSSEERKWTSPYGFACGICLQTCCMNEIPSLVGLFPMRPRSTAISEKSCFSSSSST